MTIAEATGIIAARCHGWNADSIDRLGEGDFCTAFLVNNEWVFRFAKHAMAAASLGREACLLPHIAHRFDLRVPVPHVVETFGTPAFTAYPMLPGPALTRECYLRLAEPDRERCAMQLGSFLRQMHAIDPRLARTCGVEAGHDHAYYSGVLMRARRSLYMMLAPEEQSFIEGTIEGYLESQTPLRIEPVVLHGDLCPDHVLYDESTASITGVIDFGDVCIGDAAWDLVYIYDDYGPDFLARFLRGYAPSEPRALLERVYRFHVLDAIDWAAGCAEGMTAEIGAALAQLKRLEAGGAEIRDELVGVGDVG